MSIRKIESGIIDTLLNKVLLGKRKLGLPTKYYYDNVKNRKNSRFIEMILYPKTRLDRFLFNSLEKCMPGIKYFVWDEAVFWAREYGYTLGEKFYHTFRHSPATQIHVLGQAVHPWGWLENQRTDLFISKTQGLIPGFQTPDWAQGHRRSYDLDLNSIRVPQEAMDMVFRESTPTQHINTSGSLYFAAGNLASESNVLGYPGQRLTYNEDIRGDFYKNGYLNNKDKSIVHGWYADAQADSQRDRTKNMSESELEEHRQCVARWNKMIEEFRPELKGTKFNPITHKYDEQYFERNMQDIRTAVFTDKWIKSIDSFSQEEIQSIHEFFLNGNTEAFFNRESELDEYKPNSLYMKFAKALGFPDIASLDRFITHPPEKQFYDLMDKNWGINFETVETFRSRYSTLIKDRIGSEGSHLVLEEVYNPLYRQVLKDKFKYELNQNSSFVLEALDKGVKLSELEEMSKSAKENVFITSNEVLNSMVNSQVRKIVKTFHWKGNI